MIATHYSLVWGSLRLAPIIITFTSRGTRFARPLLHPFCMNIPSCSYTHCITACVIMLA